MKQITFVRHAKSDWGEEFAQDIDRHLSARGLKDAYVMSEWFAKNQTKPDLILSSPAIRAYSTALIFARNLTISAEEIQFESRIYEAEESTLLTVIQQQSEENSQLLVFGHNPGFTNLCNHLSEDIFFDNLPTCAMVSYQFQAKQWKDIRPKTGKLIFYEFPKNFKS